MSISEKIDQPCTLEFLDSDWKLATVYTAFLFPTSQQDAIRLIYKKRKGTGGKAPVINHPVNWIIEARKELMEKGYLHQTDRKLKSSIIQSDIEPIVQSLISAGADGSSVPGIQEGVRLVLNSTWFRNFFSYEFLYHPISYRNNAIYEPYEGIIKKNPSGDRLEISNLKNRLFQLVYEIGYYSHNIRWLMTYAQSENGENITEHDDPLLKELLSSRNFEMTIDANCGCIPPHFDDTFYDCIANTHMGKINDYFPEKLLKYLVYSHAGHFIPIPVSVFLRSAPHTSSVKPLDCGYIIKKFMSSWKEWKSA